MGKNFRNARSTLYISRTLTHTYRHIALKKKMKVTRASQFLGFSYGEIFGTTLAAVVLLGPKDVPVVAKSLGRFAGKMVGYSHAYREKVEKILEESEVKELREDLRGTTKALENVVGEIRGFGLRSRGSSRLSSALSRGEEEARNGSFNSDSRSRSRNSGNDTSSGASGDEQPKIFEGISAKAVGRDFAENAAKKASSEVASTVLLRALAEEEVAREALHLSKEGGLVDQKLNERR